jgi:ribosome biogenesis protein Nip4
MRPAPDAVVERMIAFAARHGNDRLVRELKEGEVKLIWVDHKRGTQLRAVSADLHRLLSRCKNDDLPTSIGEFWGTWEGDDWSPSLEAACRIGARKQSDRVIVNDQAAQLFQYGRDILGGSIIHRDDGLHRGDIVWVTDRDLNVLGLANIVDSWSARGPVLRPAIDLGWYLREGG